LILGYTRVKPDMGCGTEDVAARLSRHVRDTTERLDTSLQTHTGSCTGWAISIHI